MSRFFRFSVLFAAVVSSIATSSDSFDHSVATDVIDGDISLETQHIQRVVDITVSVPTADLDGIEEGFIRVEGLLATFDQDSATVRGDLVGYTVDTDTASVDPTQADLLIMEVAEDFSGCWVSGSRCYVDWSIVLTREVGTAEVDMAYTAEATVHGPLGQPIPVSIEFF